MPYECLKHKEELIKSYDHIMFKASKQDPQVERMLHLLQFAITDQDYEEFGELLRQPEVIAKFNEAYDTVLEKYDLMQNFSKTGLSYRQTATPDLKKAPVVSSQNRSSFFQPQPKKPEQVAPSATERLSSEKGRASTDAPGA